jgi:thiol-disulfide isomerase/thioredoxin
MTPPFELSSNNYSFFLAQSATSQNIFIVNFYSTNCTPCILFNEFYDNFASFYQVTFSDFLDTYYNVNATLGNTNIGSNLIANFVTDQVGLFSTILQMNTSKNLSYVNNTLNTTLATANINNGTQLSSVPGLVAYFNGAPFAINIQGDLTDYDLTLWFYSVQKAVGDAITRLQGNDLANGECGFSTAQTNSLISLALADPNMQTIEINSTNGLQSYGTPLYVVTSDTGLNLLYDYQNTTAAGCTCSDILALLP